MDRAEFGNRRGTVGTVNATSNLYGDRILERSPLKKPQMDFVKVYSKELSKSHFTISFCFVLFFFFYTSN
jgi:hypothetical protein